MYNNSNSGPTDGAASGVGDGRSLGGSATPASPDEIRRRRLAALQGHSSISAAAENQQPVEVDFTMNQVDDDEDAQLQAALAMSLQTDNDVTMAAAATTRGTPMDAASIPMDKTTTASTQASEQSIVDEEGWCTTITRDMNIASFHEIMWDSLITTDNDKSRWVGQGIHTRESASPRSSSLEKERSAQSSMDSMQSLVGSDHAAWGLTQAHGGPCGVLAAVQAELLRLLLFGRRQNDLVYPTELNDDEEATETRKNLEAPSPELVQKGLAMAIALILARAAITPSAAASGASYKSSDEDDSVSLALPTTGNNPQGLTWDDLEPWSPTYRYTTALPSCSSKLRVYTISGVQHDDSSDHSKRQKKNSPSRTREQDRIVRLAMAVTRFLLHHQEGSSLLPLDSFRHAGGVLLLVMSLVESRTVSVIQSDMDDPTGTRLTSQFGHCSQELINLLLTGQAVSNVFDNTLTPSGALTCRGIQNRPGVGYLSQLESLRYCEVGGYYKSPRFPIWVVGSTSHFTVLFGSSNCLKESKSDLLLERCRRAFKAVEGGEENGFIDTTSLADVLKSLDLNYSDSVIQTLAATLEMNGASVILWGDFWIAVSRLMTGATMESVLQKPEYDDMPKLTWPKDGEVAPPTPTAAAVKPQPSQVDSDEELARKLAAEWGSPGGLNTESATISSSDAVAARPASPMDMDTKTAAAGMTDEEYARQLQAEWDNNDTPGAVAIVNPPKHDVVAETKVASPTEQKQGLEFEQFGNSFKLYHYNGLRGGSLTPFSVTRLSSEEAVGHSIALSHHSTGSSGSGPQGGGGGGDLEDVVRTKWPNCTIDWLGHSPPYID